MDCKKAERLIPVYIDGGLGEEELIGLENHIGRCVRCSAIYDEFLLLEESLVSLREDVPDTAILYEGISRRLGLIESRRKAFQILSPPVFASMLLTVATAFLFLFRVEIMRFFAGLPSGYPVVFGSAVGSTGARISDLLSSLADGYSSALTSLLESSAGFMEYLGSLDLWIILSLSSTMTILFLLVFFHIFRKTLQE